MWKALLKGEEWRGHIKNKAKDGSHYWVKTLIKPVFDELGKINGFVSVQADVTSLVRTVSQRKRLELKSRSISSLNRLYAIERSNRELPQILLEALEILFEAPWLKVLEKGGVFFSDPDTKQLELVASHMLGPDIENLCSKVKYGHCLCGRAAQTRKPVFASCVDERHDVRFDAMRPHGHYNMPILVGSELIGVMVVYLAHGTKRNHAEEEFLSEFAHTLGVIISHKNREDELVSEKQRAEVAAEMAKDSMLEAQAAEQSKTNFLATMSHELRTPLNGIVGMLHAVKQSPLSVEQQEDLDIALTSSDILLRLINDILDFSKLEYGSMELELTKVNIRQLIEESNYPFMIAAKEKGLELTRVCGHSPQGYNGCSKVPCCPIA
jgi:hypothetical protein